MGPKKSKGGGGSVKTKGANKAGRAQEPATPVADKGNVIPPKKVEPEPAVEPLQNTSAAQSNGASDVVSPSLSQKPNGTTVPDQTHDSRDFGASSFPSPPAEAEVSASTPWGTSPSNGFHPSFDDSKLSSSIVRVFMLYDCPNLTKILE